MDAFHVYTDKRIYFPGQSVWGSVQYMPKRNLACNGILVELVGVGRSDIQNHSMKTIYAYGRAQCNASVFESSPLICKADCFNVGAPWDKNHGVFVLDIPTESHLQPPILQFRLVESGVCHSDIVFGACDIDINLCLNSGPTTFPVNMCKEYAEETDEKVFVTVDLKWNVYGNLTMSEFNFENTIQNPSFRMTAKIVDISNFKIPSFMNPANNMIIQLVWASSAAAEEGCKDMPTLCDSFHFNQTKHDRTPSEVTVTEIASMISSQCISSNADGSFQTEREDRGQAYKMLRKSSKSDSVFSFQEIRYETLPTGIYNIRYRLDLPPDIPSTIVSENGSVVYYIRVSLDHADSVTDCPPSSCEFFTVVQPHVASTMLQKTHRSASWLLHRRLSLCCVDICDLPFAGNSGELSVDVVTDRTAYAPNEYLTATAVISPKCKILNAKLVCATAVLRQRVQLMAGPAGINKSSPADVLLDITSSVNFKIKENVATVEVNIPPVPPSYYGNWTNKNFEELQLQQQLQQQQQSNCVHPIWIPLGNRSDWSACYAADAITWSYELVTSIQCHVDHRKLSFQVCNPICIAAVPLAIYSSRQLQSTSCSLITAPSNSMNCIVQPANSFDGGIEPIKSLRLSEDTVNLAVLTATTNDSTASLSLPMGRSASLPALPLQQQQTHRDTLHGIVPWRSVNGVSRILTALEENCMIVPQHSNVCSVKMDDTTPEQAYIPCYYLYRGRTILDSASNANSSSKGIGNGSVDLSRANAHYVSGFLEDGEPMNMNIFQF